MNNYLILIIGIIIVVIGFRAFPYFDNNKDTINNEPQKLFNIAILTVFLGLILSIISIVSIIKSF